MTDPLRPLVSLLESVSRASSSTGAASSHSSTATSSPAKEKNSPQASQESPRQLFVGRLSARLAGLDRRDHRQIRKAFVEVALLSELGDHLAVDSRFAELIDDVVAIISHDARTVADLDKVLESIPI